MGDDKLTFVATIHFGFADEGRRVDFVAAKEHIGRICDPTTNISSHLITTTTIVALVQGASASSKET